MKLRSADVPVGALDFIGEIGARSRLGERSSAAAHHHELQRERSRPCACSSTITVPHLYC